ncbi:MAG: tetratricopeptide repeat protein, partial [Acidobacteriota bacterium]
MKAPTTTQKKLDENAEWEKATTVADGEGRIAALRKFIVAFPKSAKNSEAFIIIATVETQLGNEKLTAGDIAAATTFYQAAVADAPKPIPDDLFKDLLAKIPANLYFRNARAEAIAIATGLEAKSDTNASQLLGISTFYMSVENGTEARRLAESAIKLAPDSAAAYQSLGLANRMTFDLDESAAAYAKALELDPESLAARRGLAEMKRSLGKADEAAALYREILARDAANTPAQTGLVLALFDAGKRADAEAELTRALEATPGNVILLAGAAYWYAAHDDGQKAIELAQKAIASDPRFIWSHIALARGLLSQNKPAEAEKILLAARRYGNFPTLEYEIASARITAGYYREAAEELAKSFSVKDGVVHTDLGGRVPRDAKNFTELVGFERRASIFAPVAADDPETAIKLTQLLILKQELDAAEPKPEAVAKAADDFVSGTDRMKVHRQIFAASQLLDKKIALPKVIALAKDATANVDAGLDIANAATAVMAGEMYENRSLAETRGEYLFVPDVPRVTLSTIIRGQIEELSGWASFQMDDPAEAAIRLKRAVSVLPVDSAWWRASTWQLATALAHSGKDAEALDMYIKSYKSSGQTPIRYGVIAALYKKVNGSTEGLEAKIGPNPAAAEPVSQKVEPSSAPEAKADLALTAATEIKPEPTPSATEIKSVVIPTTVPVETPKIEPVSRPIEVKTPPNPASNELKPETTPTPTVTETPKPEPTPRPAEVKAEPTPLVSEVKQEPTPTPAVSETPKPESTPRPAEVKTEPSTSVTDVKMEPTPTPVIGEKPKPELTQQPTPEDIKVAVREASAKETPESRVLVSTDLPKTLDEKPKEVVQNKPTDPVKELFPPVVITIPPPAKITPC